MTGRIILLRHGQTHSNVARLLDTRPPGAELTERGREQAADAGRELVEVVGERHLRMYCSIALRAQQTAQLAARAFEAASGRAAHEVRVEVLPGVHEVFAGEFELDASEDAHRSYMVALRGWLDGDDSARMAGGESYLDVLGRYQPALEALAADLGPTEDAVVVSHGAAIRVASRHATGVDADFAYSGYIANCRFIVLEPRGREFGQWELKCWADTELAAPETQG